MTHQYIEFSYSFIDMQQRVSLPIGSFGYYEALDNKTTIFLLGENSNNEFWIIEESYDSFKARVMALT